MTNPNEIEVELKLLLPDAEALERIASALSALGATRSTPAHQRNRFFDTPSASLREAGVTLRLREEDGRFELTAKGPGEVQGDVHRRAELEIELQAGPAGEVGAGQVDPLALLEQEFGAEHALLVRARAAQRGVGLAEVGAFENVRTRVGPVAVGSSELFVELDRTSLPGGRTDHELELEFPAGHEEEAAKLVQSLLADAGVQGTPASSKAKRFFALLAARPGV